MTSEEAKDFIRILSTQLGEGELKFCCKFLCCSQLHANKLGYIPQTL